MNKEIIQIERFGRPELDDEPQLLVFKACWLRLSDIKASLCALT